MDPENLNQNQNTNDQMPSTGGSDFQVTRPAGQMPGQMPGASATPPEHPAPKGSRRKLLYSLVGLLLVVVVAALAYSALHKSNKPQPAAVQNREVKIGFLAPLGGENTQIGTAAKQAVELAVKEFRKEGITIRLIPRDGQCTADKAEPAAKDLINNQKVVAIIGEYCSGATLAVAPLANQNHIPLISPSSTSPKVTDAGDYVFRAIPSDALQGEFITNLIHTKDHLNRLAILHSDESYGNGLSALVVDAFQKAGGTIVANEAFVNETTNLQTQLANIKKANPDSVYLISSSPVSASAALLGIKNVALKARLYGSESMKSQPSILEDAGNAAEGLVVTAVSEGSSGFSEKYKAAYGVDPSGYGAQSYDAFKAIAAALNAGAVTSEQIKDQLYKVDFQGASGHIKFDKNGDVAGNYNIYVVKDRKYVLSTQ